MTLTDGHVPTIEEQDHWTSTFDRRAPRALNANDDRVARAHVALPRFIDTERDIDEGPMAVRWSERVWQEDLPRAHLSGHDDDARRSGQPPLGEKAVGIQGSERRDGGWCQGGEGREKCRATENLHRAGAQS